MCRAYALHPLTPSTWCGSDSQLAHHQQPSTPTRTHHIAAMPCWLLVLNDGGFPLFSRSCGLPADAFSFPTLGLLSAVHSSADSAGFALQHIHSHDAAIVYQTFPAGLILVYSSSDTHLSSGDVYVREKLSAMYASMVLVNGRVRMHDMKSVERMKRQIRVSRQRQRSGCIVLRCQCCQRSRLMILFGCCCCVLVHSVVRVYCRCSSWRMHTCCR